MINRYISWKLIVIFIATVLIILSVRYLEFIEDKAWAECVLKSKEIKEGRIFDASSICDDIRN